LDTIRTQLEKQKGFTHRPRLNRRSVELEKQNQTHTERNMALLERGKEYQSSKRQKIIEKESEEISKCSFKPQINTYTG
jgi:hypothetical protein